ncbi:hypothetical protein RMATCC62417_18755 [Rhizopus microsporus]|nr:hypothetical protein RMATCC62417_18755 [Rhizopus microsporus]
MMTTNILLCVKEHTKKQKKEMNSMLQVKQPINPETEQKVLYSSLLSSRILTYIYIAKQLSIQGHKHDERMKEFNRQAAEYIYAKKNQGRPPNEIDLHGLFVTEASEKVEQAIQHCQSAGMDHLVIIVGKGLHSPGQIAKLKPAIIELVRKYNVSCQPNIPNPGCLYVEFGKGTGDLSWLDRITDKMAKGDACVIM